MDTATMELNEYDPMSMLEPDMTVVVVGARGSGKSVLMEYLLYCMRDKLDIVTVFCPTRESRHVYEKHVQKCFVYPDFKEEWLKRICAAQRMLSEVDGEKQSRIRSVGVVLDDCMHDKVSVNCNTMRYLYMNGRHDKLFLMNGVQYVMDIRKEIRSQIDIAFVFPQPSAAFRDALRENLLGGCFESDEQLKNTFEALQAHEMLIYDMRANRRRKPCLFFFKAPFPLPEPNFLVGKRLFWEMYYRHMVRKSNKRYLEHIHKTVAAAVHKPGEGELAADGALPPPVVLIRRKPTAPPPSDAPEAPEFDAMDAGARRRKAQKRVSIAPAAPLHI